MLVFHQTQAVNVVTVVKGYPVQKEAKDTRFKRTSVREEMIIIIGAWSYE